MASDAPREVQAEVRARVTAAWRRESTRLVAALLRLTRDLELAEDLAQDALVAALEQWPGDGIPANPGAWLMQVAKRRAIDTFRRNATLRDRTAELARSLPTGEEAQVPDLDATLDHVEDDVLRLILLTCHPLLSPESRAALTLRLVAGLTTAEIARAFLARESAVGQRITRAKKTLAEHRVDLEVPVGQERTARLDDVMSVVYLIFNEGYTATSGEDWTRPDLCHEGIRLARMLAVLEPRHPDTHGLQALLELQASRLPARLDADGAPVLLEAQDRVRWDQLLLRHGLAALDRATAVAREREEPIGPITAQAHIAACHARARTAEETDWPRIARWYDALSAAAPGPVVEVNRAVAHGRAHGPDAGLAVLDALAPGALAGSHLLPSVRGDLLARAGRHREAAGAFSAAISLTANEGERSVLRRRRAESLAADVGNAPSRTTSR
ncbi:RNA polymerase sigma factor [Nocardioides houyundeii]|uniref:RNA polymerase sigma factor n=1 Tax=Nocardioides houyundeii TaxID=2045452 RepID=UPI000DF35F6A|nr:RNA polymerase sigma factor [Nocardioides houyundeii]